MKNNKMIKFSIIIFMIFISIFMICQLGASMLYGFMINSKYNMLLICEILMSLMMVVLLLLSGNKYTFIYKKEKFFKSLKLAIPLIAFSFFYLFIGIFNIILVQKDFNIHNFVTIILLCVSIGFFEELLCRGWLLNQYLKRFGNTKNGVIKSIVISSFLFGLLHMINLLAGQSLLLTIMQVIQTTALGFLWGTIYYRTKNIWSCIFIHGFYDFCIMISNVNYIKDPIADNGILVSIFTTLFLAIAWVSSAIRLLNRRTLKEMSLVEGELTNEDIMIDEKNNTKYNIITCISIVLCFVCASLLSSSTKVIEFKYEEIKIDKYITHFINYDEYVIDNRVSIKLNDIMGLDIKDINTNKIITINKMINSYSIIENDNYFELLIYDGTNLYYGKYDYSVNINNIEKELVKINVPTITNIGYLTSDTSELEPYFITDTKYEFIIKDSKLFLIK